MLQYLRSLIFTVFMMVSACFFSAIMTLCFWLPYRHQFAIARFWAGMEFWMLARICGLSYVVSGKENIPPGNHIAKFASFQADAAGNRAKSRPRTW